MDRGKNSQVHYNLIDKKTGSVIRQRSLNGLMSDARWVKLLGHLIMNANEIRRMEFKSLDGIQGIIYISPDREFNFDYWDTGFEGMNSRGGWLTYKEIEYVRFPGSFDNGRGVEEQDIKKIEELIRSIGILEMFTEKDALILLCYK